MWTVTNGHRRNANCPPFAGLSFANDRVLAGAKTTGDQQARQPRLGPAKVNAAAQREHIGMAAVSAGRSPAG